MESKYNYCEYKIFQNKYVFNDTVHLITINSSKELNDYLHKDKN